MNKCKKVQKVLIITLILNATVSIIKLVLGYLFKISVLVADGLHSFTDSLNNIAGLVIIKISSRKNDSKHPYGYEKYETIATLVIAVLIVVVGYETLMLGIRKIISPSDYPEINNIVYYMTFATVIINIITYFYEHRKGTQLASSFLIADSNETKGDIFISIGVLLSIYSNHLIHQLPIDGLFTILISIIIFKNGLDIFKDASIILLDQKVIDEKKIYDIVISHPKVVFCHAIRSRGKSDAIFIDFHMGVDKDMSVEEAHDVVNHEVKLMLRDNISGLKSALIHIEPQTAEKRSKSVFIRSDY